MMKRLSRILILVVILGMLPFGALPAAAEKGTPKDMEHLFYDDHVDLAGRTVEIVDAGTPTSRKIGKQVPGGTPDDAVVTLEGTTLIATGTGTARVKIDGVTYRMTVSAAPISLFMITGHSMGAGEQGSAEQSVICPPGQVYSSYGTANLSADTSGVGIGYGAGTKARGIDAFTADGTGTAGEGSALGYRWNQLTGEKVWILNTAVGGSCLPEWIEGTANYNNAVKQFSRAQQILKNEIDAGHYTLSRMGIFYHSGANFAFKEYTYTQQDLKNWYQSMWNGFKRDLALDLDGEAGEEGLSFLGLIPIWTKSVGRKYTQDEPACLYMASSREYPDVFLASVIGSQWLTNRSVAENFPALDYPIRGGKPARPTGTDQVFAEDNVHYRQVAYNAVGMDIAEHLAAYLFGPEEPDSAELSRAENFTPLTGTVELSFGEELSLVPQIEPIVVNDLDIRVSGNIAMDYPMVIRATGNGKGTLTLSRNGRVLNELTFLCADAPGPVIVTQPVDAEASLGERYAFTVEAKGENLTCNWYISNANGDQVVKIPAQGDTYEGVMTEGKAGSVVYCVVTDGDGYTAVSETARLIRVASEKLEIITQPANGEAVLGGTYSVRVEAKGEDLTYQWYIRNPGSAAFVQSSVTSDTYSDVMTEARANREVFCVIRDCVGNTVVTDVVKLVRVASTELKILAQPEDVRAAIGERYNLTVEAQGEDIRYEWYYRNAGENRWHKSPVTGETYHGVMTEAEAGREVCCVVTDVTGDQRSTGFIRLIPRRR